MEFVSQTSYNSKALESLPAARGYENLEPSRQPCGSGLLYHQKNWGKSKTLSTSIPLWLCFCCIVKNHTSFIHQALGSVFWIPPHSFEKTRGLQKKQFKQFSGVQFCRRRNGGPSFVEGWCLFPPHSKHVDVVVPPAIDVKDPRSSSPEERNNRKNTKKNHTTWIVTQKFHGNCNRNLYPNNLMENMKRLECWTKHPTQNSHSDCLRAHSWAHMETEDLELKPFLACLPIYLSTINPNWIENRPPCNRLE